VSFSLLSTPHKTRPVLLLFFFLDVQKKKSNSQQIDVFLNLRFSSFSLGKWTYKSPVFLGENQEFSIFWPKNRAFFPITTGTYKSISLDCHSSLKIKDEKGKKRFENK